MYWMFRYNYCFWPYQIKWIYARSTAKSYSAYTFMNANHCYCQLQQLTDLCHAIHLGLIKNTFCILQLQQQQQSQTVESGHQQESTQLQQVYTAVSQNTRRQQKRRQQNVVQTQQGQQVMIQQQQGVFAEQIPHTFTLQQLDGGQQTRMIQPVQTIHKTAIQQQQCHTAMPQTLQQRQAAPLQSPKLPIQVEQCATPLQIIAATATASSVRVWCLVLLRQVEATNRLMLLQKDQYQASLWNWQSCMFWRDFKSCWSFWHVCECYVHLIFYKPVTRV